MKKRLMLIIMLALQVFAFSACSRSDSKGETNATVEIEKEESSGVMEEENLTYGTYYDAQGNNINYTWPKATSCMVMPILQNPGQDNVTVQWFTEGEGREHSLVLYENGADLEPTRIIAASTMKMSRIRGGKNESDCNNPHIEGNIYKHIAYVDGLPEYHGNIEERISYKIVSDNVESEIYSLSAAPTKGTPLRVLMTSDLQIKNMCAANIQKVYETVGYVDAILVDGDIVEVEDRQYDWFYADNAFFRIMTGTADDEIAGTSYKGAPFLQNCPLYTAIGNHDVMGVYDNSYSLVEQFNLPATREHAKSLLDLSDTSFDEAEAAKYIEDNSYNTITYEEIFELPKSDEGGEKYYHTSFGDIGLISLDASRIWRSPNVGGIGAYSEDPGSNEYRNLYGYGSFIFESLAADSIQADFLKKAVVSDDYKNSKIKICMMHSEAHSLGANQVPAYTDPIKSEVKDPVTGKNMVIYDYPISNDYIQEVVEPVLEESGTNLLFEAHSHIWNRFITESGMNVLESSNVGNNYGGFMEGDSRGNVPSAFSKSSPYYSIKDSWDSSNYFSNGDPFGLEPMMPNKANLPDGKPYLADDSITAFSILDTGKMSVDSYYFNTDIIDEGVVLFDSFTID